MRFFFSLWFALNRSLAQVFASHSFIYFTLVRRFFFIRLAFTLSILIYRFGQLLWQVYIIVHIARFHSQNLYSSTVLLLRLLLLMLFELPIFHFLSLYLDYTVCRFCYSLRVLSSHLRICEFCVCVCVFRILFHCSFV